MASARAVDRVKLVVSALVALGVAGAIAYVVSLMVAS
jgi:hypothetical protein